MKPPIEFSALGERFLEGTGISLLMDDLGRALADAGSGLSMLGGGNPAAVPEARELWRTRMAEILDGPNEQFDRMLGNYDTQRGNQAFIEAVSGFFQRTYGWEIGPENVAVTNGGQNAFFYLFNLLGGRNTSGSLRRILLPLVPEYIGYDSLSLEPGTLVPVRAAIEDRAGNRFKYRIDFERLPWDESIAAACVSRPTNPSANVLTDEEVRRLHRECRDHNALLIIDNAYGTPFPHLVFTEAEPFWDEGVILTYSLSKLGLPGTRTGIVLGPPRICEAIAAMNAVVGLATGNIGQEITRPLFKDGRIATLSRNALRPFYQERAEAALRALDEAFAGLPLKIHQPEGALFLWLWFPELGIDSTALYHLFRDAGVIVVPGHYFFHGLEDSWPHAQECIRVNHALDAGNFPAAAHRMAEAVRRALADRKAGAIP